jgi:hypothetical protein
MASNLSSFDWIQPLLITRKDIWTFFPVTVVPLGSDENGAECHAIEWHTKNLRQWMLLWNIPRFRIHQRLMTSLEASTKWYVDPPRTDSMLCVIRMRFRAAIPDRVEQTVPTLMCLNDVKQYFPVVWHRLPTSSEYPIYSVELYANQIATMTKSAGYDITAKVKKELTTALKASPAWRCLDAEAKNEFCRLQIMPRSVN